MSSGTDLREDWRNRWERIERMLFDAGLEPSPRNFEAAHRFVSGEDPRFCVALERAIVEDGRLTPLAIEAAYEDEVDCLSTAEVSRLASEVQAHLESLGGVLESEGAAARDYHVALDTEARGLGGPDTAHVVEKLIQLTRRMVERNRASEARLEEASWQVSVLRSNLAEARRRAESDPLTGLANRRALDQRLAEAVKEGRACGRPVTLAICDIDHFKLVNDTHGHAIGDEVIKLVARSLAGEGGRLFVSRYGGEEFVVLFEDCMPAAAAAAIDEIRLSLAKRDIKVKATGSRLGRITFSTGVAGLTATGSVSDMLRRADVALYRAKKEGRDAVRIAADVEPPHDKHL